MIDIKKVDLTDSSIMDKVAKLCSFVFKEDIDSVRDTLLWKHVENPFGKSLAFGAWSDGELVGIRCFMRWRFEKAGYFIEACRPVDTVTHPKFQRKGIFSKLTSEAVNQCNEEKINLIYNTPNKKSAPGYLKLGWKKETSIKFIIKPINFIPVVIAGTKKILGIECEKNIIEIKKSDRVAIERFDVDDKLNYIAPEGEYRTLCSNEYFKWRYFSNKRMQYGMRKFGNYYIVFKINERFGLKELVICEVYNENNNVRPITKISKSLKLLAKELNCDYYIMHKKNISYSDARLWLHKIPFGLMDIYQNKLSKDEFNIQDVNFTLGDIEVF